MPSTANIRFRFGWVPDLPDMRDLRYAAIAKPIRVPRKVDLRKLCSPVENQGDLGACTGNALVGNLEFLCRKATGKKAPDYSRLFIYYNERVIEGTISEDAGAQIRDGVKSLVKQGVCLESMWPYQIDRFTVKPPRTLYDQAKQHRVTSYHRIESLSQMEQCLSEGYPFVFGFSVYESFQSDEVMKTGVVPMPSHGEQMVGGHAVMAVGFDSSIQRFIVRNSWGPDWGDGGYFTIPYAYLASRDLSDDFWTLRAFEGQATKRR